jgi:hypothetical protein
MSNAGPYSIRNEFVERVNTADGETMNDFYLCPTCFYVSDVADDGHEHTLLRVDPGLPGDERRKPVTDQNGHIQSPAPRWFYEAVLQARTAQHNLQP